MGIWLLANHSFPHKLLELEPGPFSAANKALTALTITAIRAGSWTTTATTGAENVEGVCGALNLP